MRIMRIKFLITLIAITLAIVGIVLVLNSEKTAVVNTKGIIATQELQLILTNAFLKLLIIVPTYILLFVVVWKYCIKNKNAKYDPEHSFGSVGQLIMWLLPTLIVVAMAIVTWRATHQLDPRKPIDSVNETLTIQVVALDWKWLFIYPDLGIATLNYLEIPENTPIRLRLTADGSPMNSFWIPQLSGQIYSMTGMSTELHLMANGIGDYVGKAVEINGDGYADMTFAVKSTSQADFEKWSKEIKTTAAQNLTEKNYEELLKPAINKSVIFFGDVEKDLYHKIVHKYMYPIKPVL